eukprot:CAMPEP_0167797226 /NCGR_PEP_ID=MMETSP0111_2-20121227/15520_1 /TAXON_ID=91324 /ORGANISM="Lotharella globosa, Strain CCCM811" /LENGTH=903 /DNA_ID=CAMNT_0007691275 /DNA_START=124 /DNA_END=2832 /DNA_ORIENTATION=+
MQELNFSKKQLKRIYCSLLQADLLEQFMSSKFPASKKFGIEGCWSLIPGLIALMSEVSSLGTEYVELGMTHRGRINVLLNLLKRPMHTVLYEFLQKGSSAHGFYGGDVQYHLGAYSHVRYGGQRGEQDEDEEDHKIHLSMCPNPSHLESINPVVMGKVRAKQNFLRDYSRQRVVGVLLHGDASFSGQGVVHETMELSELDAYTVGGMLHIIINNQIGFTTDPRTGRSSVHPTNVAKAVGAPVFHVNGDDVLAVVKACQMAARYRHKYKRDAVINIVCYRKHGHNELDDPKITHPLTYNLIENHPSTLELFTQYLLDHNQITPEEIQTEKEKYLCLCESELSAAKEFQPNAGDLLSANWQGDAVASLGRPFNQTGATLSMLKDVGESISTLPTDFQAHAKVQEVLSKRQKAIRTGEGVDFAFAEALAFGSLMLPFKAGDQAEGKRGKTEDLVQRPMEKNAFLSPMVDHPTVHVRLAGQDVERGTFNQRHAVVIDQTTAARYVPLDHITDTPGGQASFSVCNSSLSEEAALGFEYGYSLENDNALVIWEAQFGDFANNAQAMIDNFIASGEDKWLCQSGLVLLLPHGYEGQGPEHSSARLERYLSLVNDDADRVSGNQQTDTDRIMHMFEELDRDRDGTLSLRQIQEVIGEEQINNVVELQSLEGTQTVSQGQEEYRFRKEDYVRIMLQWLARNTEARFNMSVCNVTTPANYFHVLRRQIHRPYAKPLVLMSPKYLLHHAPAVSPLKHFEVGTHFNRVISDTASVNNLRSGFVDLNPVVPGEAKKVLVCSGKVAYALHHSRKAKRKNDIVLIRLEQLAPFPVGDMITALAPYSNAEVVWVQEEPKNMGAWNYVQPRLTQMLRLLRERGLRVSTQQEVSYVGREPSASTATGSFFVHMAENKQLLE